jgi:hypothetical protein
MPNTYSLISSNVLSSSAASVTFSSIPATFTDLVLRMSVASTGVIDGIFRFNGSSATNYSRTYMQGTGSTTSSSRSSNSTNIGLQDLYRNNGSTSNTFSSSEIYIPSYTVSQSKPISAVLADESNNTTADMTLIAGLFRDNTAISSFSIAPNSGNFSAGSSFYLYGIKNS